MLRLGSESLFFRGRPGPRLGLIILTWFFADKDFFFVGDSVLLLLLNKLEVP